jgi:hypothetical protein
MSGSRNPAASIPSMGGGVRGGDVAGVLTAVRSCPVLDGRLTDVVLDGTTDEQPFAHGLGRRYRGGIVVGYEGASVVVVKVLRPEWAESESGVDPAKYVVVLPSAASSATLTLWVF